MFVWDKLGRIFNPQDVQGLDWMKEYAQAPCSLVFKDFVRVYFSCRPFPDDNAQYKSYTGYVDLDRSNLFNILRVSKEPILYTIPSNLISALNFPLSFLLYTPTYLLVFP